MKVCFNMTYAIHKFALDSIQVFFKLNISSLLAYQTNLSMSS